METVEITSEGATAYLTRYDLVILTNALNEICHADLPNFDARIGSSLLETKRLYEKIAKTQKAVSQS